MEINCKQYHKHDCETINPNCIWGGKRNCIRRNGVLQGKRYKYDSNGNVVEIIKDSEFEFVYNPELDSLETSIEQVVLGYGTYGITFIPAFPCVNGQTFPKSLGKVFYSQEHADSEWELSKVLQKIEHGTTQKYFSYPKFECHIPFPKNPISIPEKELYGFFQKQKLPIPDTLPQHVMEYSGMTLDTYIKKYYPNEISRAELIDITENLFYAVKRLNDFGYIHQDIKASNIVISNKKRLRLIDFGLTLTENNFVNSEENLLLRSRYHAVSPPENSLFAVDLTDVNYSVVLNWLGFYKNYYKQFESIVNEQNTELFINFLKSKLRVTVNKLNKTLKNILPPDEFEILLNEIIINRDEITEFAKSQTKVPEQTVYNLYHLVQDSLSDLWEYEGFARKSDVYSIGLVLLRASYNKLSKSDDPQAIELFNTLMSGLLAFDPRRRIDINKAISLVKQIKKIPHQDPFKRNIDPINESLYLQFGKKSNLKQIDTEIKYLLK